MIEDYIDYNILFISIAITISYSYITLPENKITY